MKKTLICLSLIFLTIALVSCHLDTETKEIPNPPKVEEKALHVSFGMNNPSKAIVKVDYTINGNVEKSNITGSCIGSLTPSEFILALQDIFIYQPIDNSDIYQGASDSDVVPLLQPVVDTQVLGNDTAAITRRINTLTTKDLPINVDSKIFETVWNGFAFQIDVGCNSYGDSPDYAKSNTHDHYWTATTIAVNRSDIESIIGGTVEDKLDSDVIFEKNNDTIWLRFEDLLPYDKKNNKNVLFGLTKILFQTGIKKNSILMGNFTGRESTEPFVNYGPYVNVDDASGYVATHMEPIDFTKYKNCELLISFETKDLLKIYKINGSDKYTIILNPANPFGLSLSVGEYSESNGIYIEDSQKIEVAEAVPDYRVLYERPTGVSLTYSHPNRTDVDHFEIYYVSQPLALTTSTLEPAEISDSSKIVSTGTLIYSGTDVALIDFNNTAHEGQYWIRSVMKDGSVSKFGTFTRIQNDMINNYLHKR